MARVPKPLQTAWLVVLTIVMAWRYGWVYQHAPLGPGNAAPATAWFGWADQAAYYISARAWSTLDLSASQHLYPAGYALLVAPFYRLFPVEPFAVVNLLCWVASLWLFAALGARLVKPLPLAGVVAATVFAVVEVADIRVLYTWEIPWTSTPAATLTFAALLLSVRQLEAPAVWQGVAAAVCAGLVALVRPTDALVVMPITGILLLASILSDRRARAAMLIGTAGGFAFGPLLFVATHLLTQGWAPGRYLTLSRLIGFEPRLLPLRWVTLILGPTPLYEAGEGFAIVYPYVLPGLAGIIVALLVDRGRRLAHAAVGGGAVAMLCLYLCYRDLQVLGLFTMGNQHYFKWTLPVFALYSLFLVVITVQRRCLTRAAGAVLVVCVISVWRPVAVPGSLHASVLPDGTGLSLPDGLPDVTDRLDVRAPDDFLAIYYGDHTIDGLGRKYMAGVDFKAMPVRGGMAIIPLRPLSGPTVLHLSPSLQLDPHSPVRSFRQGIVLGIPCSVRKSRQVCRPPTP